MRFSRSPFTCSCQGGGGGGGLTDFKFGTFIGRFPSDGAAGIAVKGLNSSCPGRGGCGHQTPRGVGGALDVRLH